MRRGDAREIERDGGTVTGTPTTDNDDDRAIFGIEGGLHGATNAPNITAILRSPLPTPPRRNMGLPRSTQTSQDRTSPILRVAKHASVVRGSP